MNDFRSGDDGLWRQGHDTTERNATRTPRTRPADPIDAPTPPSPQPSLGDRHARPRRLRRLFKGLFRIGIVAAALFVTTVVVYRFANPPASALMILQRLSGQPTKQAWMPIDRISPNLVRAVIMSEDAGFCRHFGIDMAELKAAIENAQDGIARGGSTISMQTAKNLFLWPSRSYLRKAIEIPMTLVMETIWSKQRMLEIYLNIVEWGPGIFGAEAAARYHFDKPASRLSEEEAALLAVTLPAPLIRDPGQPSALLARMGRTIEARMRSSSRHTQCISRGSTRD